MDTVVTFENYYYTLNDEANTGVFGVPQNYKICNNAVVDLTVLTEEVKITSFIQYKEKEYSVTAVSTNVFCLNNIVKKIFVPETVEELRFAAFSLCKSL